MTESLRQKIVGIYTDLKFVVEKNLQVSVGRPTLAILRELITRAKDSGGDSRLCDQMLESVSDLASIPATDAFIIAGQLMKTVKPE